jgi:predicted XRE-type DNA-binding protein
MTKAEDDFEIVRGSDNVFRDLGLPNAEIELAKADLGAAIIRAQREQGLTNATAAKIAGVDVGDISRIRNADLDRFTVDRLARIARSLDPEVHVVVVRAPQPKAARG